MTGWQRPTTVIVWSNGNVMVFDGIGQQVPRYQFTMGQDEASARALAAIVPVERWDWDIWPGNLPGQATEGWLAGRAAQIARHFGLDEDNEGARAIAEMENVDGELLVHPGEPTRWNRHRQEKAAAAEERLHQEGAPGWGNPPGENPRPERASPGDQPDRIVPHGAG